MSGLLFICWLLPFAGHESELFGLAGWFDRTAQLEMRDIQGAPPAALWSLTYLCGENATLISVLWWAALAVFLMFTLGLATRITSVLTWALVVSFVGNPATQYDAEFLLVILAFYLMIGYLLRGQWNGRPTAWSRVVCSRGTSLSPFKPDRHAEPSYAANLAVRLIQVHFAIVMVISGLSKLQIGDWWSGVAFWYSLYPPFSMSPERLRAVAQNAFPLLFCLTVAQYAMLGWLIAFPFFAWRRGCRWLLLSGGVLAWLGCAFIFGEPLFGPIYLVFCLSFLTPEEWQTFTTRLGNYFRGWTGGLKVEATKKVSVRG